MQEIEILSAGDLPYFEELEKEGRAVILRFPSLEEFASFDLSAYLGEENKKELTLDDVARWLKEEAETLKGLAQKVKEFQERILNNQELREKYMFAGSIPVATPAEKVMLGSLVGRDISWEELAAIAEPLITAEERSALIIQAAVKYRDEDETEKEEQEEADQKEEKEAEA